VATLDLLAMLGTRRGPARMLVVGTARSGDAQTITHPLNRVMRSLLSRGTATAIPLGQIGESEVSRYLALRYPHHQFPPAFVQVVTAITGGTPLFLVSLVDELARREMIIEGERGARLAITIDELAAHRADSVRQLIDMQLDRLTRDEQRVLEVASVIGQDFSTALVSAALDASAEAGDLGHRPEVAAVAVGLGRAGVGELAGKAQVARVVEAGGVEVGGGVEGLDRPLERLGDEGVAPFGAVADGRCAGLALPALGFGGDALGLRNEGVGGLVHGWVSSSRGQALSHSARALAGLSDSRVTAQPFGTVGCHNGATAQSSM